MTNKEKVIISKWYIENWCYLGEQQTIARQTTDLSVLENIIKKDKSGFACDRCIHGTNDFCLRNKKEPNEYYKCFRFQYTYWKNILIKRGQWDDILMKYDHE